MTEYTDVPKLPAFTEPALARYIAAIKQAYEQSKILNVAGIDVPWVRVQEDVTLGGPLEVTKYKDSIIKRLRLEVR